MASKLIITLLILFTIVFVECYECEFCQGDSCNSNEIPVTSCDEQPTDSLPYNFNQTFNESVENCLHLDYVEGGNVISVRQCYRFPESINICDEIRSSLPTDVNLENCSVISDVNAFRQDEPSNQLSNTLNSLPVTQASSSLTSLSTKQSTSLLTTPNLRATVTTQTPKVTSVPSTTNPTTTKVTEQTTKSPSQPTKLPNTESTVQSTDNPSTNKPTDSTAPTTTTKPITLVTKLVTNLPPTTVSITTTTDPDGHSNVASISLFLFTAALAILVLL